MWPACSAMRMWTARSGPSNCARASSRSSVDPDLRRARGTPGRLVIAAPQPGPKPLAADGPGFSVTIDHDIGKCHAGGGVKQLLTQRHLGEHVGAVRPALTVRGMAPDFDAPSAAAPCAGGSGSIRPSSMRVCFQSFRATLIGSMPACFHHDSSLPARCTAR